MKIILVLIPLDIGYRIYVSRELSGGEKYWEINKQGIERIEQRLGQFELRIQQLEKDVWKGLQKP